MMYSKEIKNLSDHAVNIKKHCPPTELSDFEGLLT